MAASYIGELGRRSGYLVDVVSPDERVLEYAIRWGATGLIEAVPGHNEALRAAAIWVGAWLAGNAIEYVGKHTLAIGRCVTFRHQVQPNFIVIFHSTFRPGSFRVTCRSRSMRVGV